jgi:hypothetical protein
MDTTIVLSFGTIIFVNVLPFHTTDVAPVNADPERITVVAGDSARIVVGLNDVINGMDGPVTDRMSYGGLAELCPPPVVT